MQKYKVQFTPKAVRQLREIVRVFFIDYDNPYGAQKIEKAIKNKCKKLEYMPKAAEIFGVVDDIEFRITTVMHSAIVYSVNDSARIVTIHRIEYSRRDILRAILGEGE